MYNGNIAEDSHRIGLLLMKAEGAAHKGWMRAGSWDTALAYILRTMHGETSSQCWRVGGIFVMWQNGTPWWADRVILQEEILLALDPQPDVRAAVSFLEGMARAGGCAGVALGTSLSTRDKALTRLYQRFGYAHEASLLYKEIT